MRTSARSASLPFSCCFLLAATAAAAASADWPHLLLLACHLLTVVKINAFVTDRDDIAAYTAARDEFLATVADDSDDELSFDVSAHAVPTTA